MKVSWVSLVFLVGLSFLAFSSDMRDWVVEWVDSTGTVGMYSFIAVHGDDYAAWDS